MKKGIALIFSLAMLIGSLPAIAQTSPADLLLKQADKQKRYQFIAIAGSHGMVYEVYGDQMNMDWIRARTNAEQPFELDLSGLNEYVWKSNAGYSMDAQFIFGDRENESAPELRIGLGTVIGKESVIDYNNYGATGYYPGSTGYMYCMIENEFRGSAELVWRRTFRRVSSYVGVGANASASVGNELYLFTNYLYGGRPGTSEFTRADILGTQEEFAGNSALFVRGYVPLGVSLHVLNHLEFTAEKRIGVGVETLLNGADRNSMVTGSLMFGVRYNIVPHKTTSLINRFCDF